MKSLYHLFIALVSMLFILICFGCQNKDKNVQITVSAAASLQDALTEVKEAFEQDYENITVNYNFGGSGTLKHQISQGAPVDLFFSAGENPIDELAEGNLLVQESILNIVGNSLVVIVPSRQKDKVKSLKDLEKENFTHIAIGNPETVPAGQYAKEALEKARVWEELQNQLVLGKDVRQVLL